MKKIAIPKCLLLSFMTIIVFNVANAQKPQSRYRILTYGLPNFLRQNAEDVIANKWGIEFYPVGDCLTPRAIADSADKHNATVEAQIAQKYGQQWKKQFYKEVDEEFVRQQKIIALAESIDYVKKKKKEIHQQASSDITGYVFQRQNRGRKKYLAVPCPRNRSAQPHQI